MVKLTNILNEIEIWYPSKDETYHLYSDTIRDLFNIEDNIRMKDFDNKSKDIFRKYGWGPITVGEMFNNLNQNQLNKLYKELDILRNKYINYK